MLDVDVIDDPASATAALDPMRAQILAILAEPGSSATVAAVTALAAKYHDERANRGRWHRVVVAAHPIPRLDPNLNEET